jgi:hypothetical protein
VRREGQTGDRPRDKRYRKGRGCLGELEAPQQAAKVALLDSKQLERDLVARPSDVKGPLGRHVPQTRQILLLPGKIVPTVVVTPAGFDAWCGFEIEGDAAA